MQKTAAIFSGQGSQYSGMGREFYENFDYVKKIYDNASEILGYDLAELSFSGDDDKLAGTLYAQPAIFALSLASFAVTQKEISFSPYCIAGHSLGEYAALCCAGAFDISDGFKIIKARAEAMNNAGDAENSAMYAIMGINADAVKTACEEAGGFVIPVNFNQPLQTVISGDKKAAEKAADILAGAGAKAVKLSVSGAFHTKLMQNAANNLKSQISGIKFDKTKIPFYSNLTGDQLKIEDYPGYFAKHMVSPVLFSTQIQNMSAAGVDTCVEFGPKKTAATLAKKNIKALNIFSLEDLATLQKLKEAV